MTVISVVIRTFNESKHLDHLLTSVRNQNVGSHEVETIIVDSGSTDRTLEIAQSHVARILHIAKSEFTFGRSLNVGCADARGGALVFVSGHCIPAHEQWLANLVQPLLEGRAVYAYGKQIGNDDSHFSERQLFRKYFPNESQIPQKGFFANNANSAIMTATWRELRFDEQLTGLEDMDMAKRIVARGQHVAYCADAPVYHLHDESWRQIRWRYEREAVALQQIIPEIHLTFGDFLRFFTSAVLLDWSVALQERCLHKVFFDVVKYRLMQFWGGYRGNHMHRVLSREIKDRYFYPR